MGKPSQDSCLTPDLRKALMREIGREGGKSKSAAKVKACSKNLANFWKKVRRGEVPNPITGKFVRNGKAKTNA
jgi:hypothetical protein